MQAVIQVEKTQEETEIQADKSVEGWSGEYPFLRPGFKTLNTWSARDIEESDRSIAARFSLLSEAGLTLNESRAFIQMTQRPELPPATRKYGRCANQGTNR